MTLSPPQSWPVGSKKWPILNRLRCHSSMGQCRPGVPSPETADNAPHGAVRFLAEPAEKDEMKLLKDICIVVPTVVVTATAVLGVATVIGLSSWALL